MKMFKDKIGVPTISALAIVIVVSIIIIPGAINFSRKVGTGHSYAEQVEVYGSLQNIPPQHEKQIRNKAMLDGLKYALLTAFGQHIPFTILILISVGVVSNSTTQEFKRLLRWVYFLVCLLGTIFLSISTSWYQNLYFPVALGSSVMIYAALSVLLWTFIGVSLLAVKRCKVYKANQRI